MKNMEVIKAGRVTLTKAGKLRYHSIIRVQGKKKARATPIPSGRILQEQAQ